MATHRTPSQWSRLLRSYHRGDLTQAEFCARHGIATATLSYQLRRERAARAPNQSPESTPAGKAPATASLIELRPVGNEQHWAAPATARIELGSAVGPVTVHCSPGEVALILAQLAVGSTVATS